MKGLVAYFKLARVENAILPMFALVAGFTITKAADYTRLALAALVLILVHSVLTIWNDIADEAGDTHNNITRMSDLRNSGDYDVLRLFIGGSVCIIILALIFLPNTSKLLVSMSLLLGWAYNVPPIHGSHRPVLSIVLLGLAYGTIPFLLGASLGHIGLTTFYLAVGWTLGRSSLSLLKDYKDATGDAVAKKRTFLLVYGGTLTAKLSFSLALLGYAISAIIVVTQVQHTLTTILLLGGVAAWLLYERTRLFKAKHYNSLDQIFHDCLKYQLVFDGLVILCLRTL
jgi:4-hydroxybenzoate polyprenyltransferase